MKVLIVRAAEDARRTAARLAAAGHQAIVAPVLAIRDLDFAPPDGAFDAVVATSAHAFGQPERLAAFRSLPVHVVGARTAEAAREAGFRAAPFVAANAAELATSAQPALAGARVLYLTGRDRKPDLEAALGPSCRLVLVETYAAEPLPALASQAIAALASGDCAVLHYSQRSAAIFLDLAGKAGIDLNSCGAGHIAISPDAARPLISADLPVAVAARPNEDSMIEELAAL